MRYHLTPVRMATIKNLQTINAGEGVEEREPFCSVGGNVNGYSHYGEEYGGFLKKIKIELPTIPLLGMYPEKNMIQRDSCTPVFIAALFTVAKTWKQPKCLSSEEWIKKMWYIYIVQWNISHKKEWNNAICSNMDEPRDDHTKWS